MADIVPVESPEPRVLHDVTLVAMALDPAYTPPWPGAGIKAVD